MHSFNELSQIFEQKFNVNHFPGSPASLYDAAQYLIAFGGKRIRPLMCIMGNELFDTIHPDSWQVASAIELFHNFTLIHDDIMDRAPLRRGVPTVHARFGEATALLAGDVMLVAAYASLNTIQTASIHKVLQLFNTTATQVCEGQQLDMDFEKCETVSLDDYQKMIELKTSVLLAASLQLGAILGGAGIGNQQHLFEFGKNLGIAFQVQDDYLDAFGDPEKFGKKQGGDIIANKKTFLLIGALQSCAPHQLEELLHLMRNDHPDKIERVLHIYKSCQVDLWARDMKEKYTTRAFSHLEEIAVLSARKAPLRELSQYLLHREM